jgi:hypothetical protein
MTGPVLFCIFDRTGLSDHHDFYLPRILEILFELSRNVKRELGRMRVIHLVVAHDDTNLTPRLDGVCFVYTLETPRNVLELLEALDIRFECFAPRARPRTAYCVGRFDDRCIDRRRFDMMVVAGDRVYKVVTLTVKPGQFAADLGVRSIHLVRHRFSHVV